MIKTYKMLLLDIDYYNENIHDCDCIIDIARRVDAVGGKTYLVGGWVRDRIKGHNPKDMDIEIHGLTPEQIKDILNKVSNAGLVQKGVSFGVYGIKGYEFDIAMPRTEHCIGVKHTDFEVSVDPFMGVEMASMRRDFTINAMMYDVINQEVIDCHGGMEDLQNGVIRHVNDETYVEDALRVFRAAQFSARFGFSIDESTIALSRTVLDIIPMLSGERIYEELKKALMKAVTPSTFFYMLDKMDALQCWFPELYALKDTPQEPMHHPEGNAFIHTMMVVDEAAKLRGMATNAFSFMVAALCHDFGKAVTTEYNNEKKKYTSYGHDLKGIPLAETLMNRLHFSNSDKKYVMNMVELHMRPNMLAKASKKASKYNGMFDIAISPEDLLLLAKSDALGRKVDIDYSPVELMLKHRLGEYYSLMDTPQVTARDLMNSGIEPGPKMGMLLHCSHKLHLSGVKKEIALKTVLKQNRGEL